MASCVVSDVVVEYNQNQDHDSVSDNSVEMQSVFLELQSDSSIGEELQDVSNHKAVQTEGAVCKNTIDEILAALDDEDFRGEEGHSRFLASQLQMMEQYRLQRDYYFDISSDGHSSAMDDDDDEIYHFGAHSHSGSSAGHTPRVVRRLPERGRSAMDELFGGDADNDAYFRTQLELLRTLGLWDENIVIPPEDTRPIEECQVCLEMVRLEVRPCCRKPVCDECLEHYVEMQITDNGNVRIGCPISDCDSRMYQDEIRHLLRNKVELRDRFDRWIIDLNGDPNRKTCPRCSHVTDRDTANTDKKASRYGEKIQCAECQLDWCFPCQAPWHEGVTCKNYRKGDVLLKNWAREQRRLGERNAQKCPKCKVYIQRTEGCDHMTCSRCSTEFCYRCGCRRLRPLKVFGYALEDHDLKHSIIGCNNVYKQGKPVERAVTRGAIFGAKVVGGAVATPVVVGLAAGVAGLAAGVAVVALPAYGTYRLVRKIRDQARSRKLRSDLPG